MTPQISVFIATSLDGYIARPDGAIDWLEQANASGRTWGQVLPFDAKHKT